MMIRAAVAAVALAGPAVLLAADAGELIRQGEAEMREGRPEAAVTLLEAAIVADPKSSLAHTRLGGAQLLLQDYSAAIASFQQAVSLDGANADAFIGMALAYLHTGRYGLARAALDESARADPAKKAEVERLIAWIDERAAGVSDGH
jgi:tetratricopeptide (TPR) repeat protein